MIMIYNSVMVFLIRDIKDTKDNIDNIDEMLI